MFKLLIQILISSCIILSRPSFATLDPHVPIIVTNLAFMNDYAYLSARRGNQFFPLMRYQGYFNSTGWIISPHISGLTGIEEKSVVDPFLVFPFIHPGQKKIVFIIRGSQGNANPLDKILAPSFLNKIRNYTSPDWRANYDLRNCSFPLDTKVRKSYAFRVKSFFPKIASFLTEYFQSMPIEQRHQWQVTFSGHSQGGALALLTQYLAVTTLGHEIWGPYFHNPTSNQILSYSFSPSRGVVGDFSSDQFEIFIGKHNILSQFIETDLVPRLGHRAPLNWRLPGVRIQEPQSALAKRHQLTYMSSLLIKACPHSMKELQNLTKANTHYASQMHLVGLCPRHLAKSADKHQNKTHFDPRLADPTEKAITLYLKIMGD